MTGQIPDTFQYAGLDLEVVGIAGDAYPTPADFGLHPYSTCTASWRGYALQFRCVDEHLILSTLHVNASSRARINGVKPKRARGMFSKIYRDLNVATKFTGHLLVGREFLRGMYVHMGFQRVTAFKEVLELHFRAGRLERVHDRSADAAHARQQHPGQGARPSPGESLEEWIARRFARRDDVGDSG